jgi:pimeloyl-ACP methyl ester carboxylesterase
MRNGVELDADWSALMQIATFHGRPINLVPPRVFSGAECQRINRPVLLLIGDKEVLYDPQETLEIARRLVPTLTGEIIPNANHNGAVANPEYVNARVIRFCDEHVSGPEQQ